MTIGSILEERRREPFLSQLRGAPWEIPVREHGDPSRHVDGELVLRPARRACTARNQAGRNGTPWRTRSAAEARASWRRGQQRAVDAAGLARRPSSTPPGAGARSSASTGVRAARIYRSILEGIAMTIRRIAQRGWNNRWDVGSRRSWSLEAVPAQTWMMQIVGGDVFDRPARRTVVNDVPPDLARRSACRRWPCG